jgi:hypothetical protein
MAHVLRSKLPACVVDCVKLYTGEALWLNKKLIHIHRISKDDYRYTILKKLPLIKQVPNDHANEPRRGCVWFKVSGGKFMVITVRFTYIKIPQGPTFAGHIWEMNYDEESTKLIVR